MILWLGGLEDEVNLPESAVPKIVIARSDPGNADLFIPAGIPEFIMTLIYSVRISQYLSTFAHCKVILFLLPPK